MKAQIIKTYGEANIFEPANLPDPTPGPGEVLVRMAATSINPVDWKIRRHGPPISPPLPAILGCDIAGTIIALGDGVETFKEGDQVFGCAGGVNGMPGTYAELIATDARLLSKKPSLLNMREAAALPLVTITAWESLLRAGVKENNNVLIHGGAGGVGHIAIQLAKSMGAKVFATVSNIDKASIAQSLGADATINYTQQSPEEYTNEFTNGSGFDVVIDTTGGSDLTGSFEAAKLNGQVVTIVSQFEADLTLMHVKGLSLHVVFMLIPMLHDVKRESHGKIMQNAALLADSKKLKPLLDPEVFSLDQVSKAHEKLENGKAVGKIVIDIN